MINAYEMNIANPSQDLDEKTNILKQIVYEHVADGISDMEEIYEKLQKEYQLLKVDREALRTYIIRTDI